MTYLFIYLLYNKVLFNKKINYIVTNKFYNNEFTIKIKSKLLKIYTKYNRPSIDCLIWNGNPQIQIIVRVFCCNIKILN